MWNPELGPPPVPRCPECKEKGRHDKNCSRSHHMLEGHNPNIPRFCRGCSRPLFLENLFVDDGCPCNTPRGVNFTPKQCTICGMNNCVKPGHRIKELYGIDLGIQSGSVSLTVAERDRKELK